MPPHAGHRYLVEFGRHFADRLSVLVCTLPDEPIPGELRFKWFREMFPDVNAVHITEAIPGAARGEPNSYRIWAESIREAVGGEPDYVFASEDYGFALAAELGATYIPVDPSRHNFPVSATMIREDPFQSWKYIPEPVRPYFVHRLCILGESGESVEDIAHKTANHFDALLLNDYMRFFEDFTGTRAASLEDFEALLRGQMAGSVALARQTFRFLFLRQDVLSLACEAADRLEATADEVLERFSRLWPPNDPEFPGLSESYVLLGRPGPRPKYREDLKRLAAQHGRPVVEIRESDGRGFSALARHVAELGARVDSA